MIGREARLTSTCPLSGEAIAVGVAPHGLVEVHPVCGYVFALAVVGTYGVTSYGVTERMGELGIRVALGANRANIRGLVLRDGARLALIGTLLGGVLAVALGRVLARFVFQISALDVVTFVAAPILLISAALLATYVPARRATRVDPVRVLRAD